MTKTDTLLLFLFIILATIFLLFPHIDIDFSSLFYDESRGGFYLSENIIIKFFYKFVVVVIQTFTLLIILLLLISGILKKEFLNLTKKKLIYLLLVLALGPIAIVNLVFKDNWGRVRPRHIVEFKGDKNFTPAFIKTNQCDKNCSFVCGHASAAFYFFALIPLVRFRKTMALFAFSFGSLIGLVRIVQGGHFLSDVIFSGFFVYFSYRIVYYLMFKKN